MPENVEVDRVSIALRKEIIYSKITVRRHPLNWSNRLEILALELKVKFQKDFGLCIWFVYVIELLLSDFKEWLELFTTFPEETSHSGKIFLTGDSNFPDLRWNSSQEPITPEKNTSVAV